MNLQQFFAMGGYAVYVWPSFAIVLGLLVANAFMARASHKRAIAEARRRLQMNQSSGQKSGAP
jgi:heme exporter protein D